MSARDDLVAAMEAIGEYDAMPRADRTGLDEATVMLTALTFLRKHGKHLLALLDAEPVAWIPVNERLPERNTTVLVDGGIAQLDGDDRWVSLTGIDWPGRPIAWRVTHWMPLPARPEASDE